MLVAENLLEIAVNVVGRTRKADEVCAVSK
jgi:hypothetical protein